MNSFVCQTCSFQAFVHRPSRPVLGFSPATSASTTRRDTKRHTVTACRLAIQLIWRTAAALFRHSNCAPARCFGRQRSSSSLSSSSAAAPSPPFCSPWHSSYFALKVLASAQQQSCRQPRHTELSGQQDLRQAGSSRHLLSALANRIAKVVSFVSPSEKSWAVYVQERSDDGCSFRL